MVRFFSLGLRIRVQWQTCIAHPDTGLTMRVFQCQIVGTLKKLPFSLGISGLQSGGDSFAEKLKVILNWLLDFQYLGNILANVKSMNKY